MKETKIIGDLKNLSKNKQQEIKKYVKRLEKNNIEVKLIDIRVDGYILTLSYNDKITVIEDEILKTLLPLGGLNPKLTPYSVMMYINIRSFWYMNSISLKEYIKISDEEIYSNIEFKNEFDCGFAKVYLKKVIYYSDGLLLRPKTYEELYNDFRNNGIYKVKKTYLKSINNSGKILQEQTKYFIYRFLNENNEILYVGKTIHLYERMHIHFGESGHLSQDKYKQVTKVEYVECNNEADMSVKEIYFINKYKPPFNTSSLWDGEISNEVYDNISWKNILDYKEVI